MITAIDSLGDVIVCGDFTGPTDLDSVRRPWAFVSKRIGSDGAERWTKLLLGVNSMSHVSIGAMVITPLDEIIVAGFFVGSVDVGGQTLSFDVPEPPNRRRAFLAKYAGDGNLLWVHGLSSTTAGRRWLWLSI